jgi:homoserine dehydrogenase
MDSASPTQVVILGRCLGLRLDLTSLPVESIVPEPLRALPTAEAFLAALPSYDAHFERLRADAAAAGEVLRYVGVVDVAGGGSAVRVQRCVRGQRLSARVR